MRIEVLVVQSAGPPGHEDGTGKNVQKDLADGGARGFLDAVVEKLRWGRLHAGILVNWKSPVKG